MSLGPVKDFYAGKNVLLTGGTGYFGKMIVQKLLSSTAVNGIFLVVRPKQDVNFEKRVTKMFEEEVFKLVPEAVFIEKIRPIEGDLTKQRLGISQEDQLFLRQNINIVFHCGASLSMDSNLTDAVMTNVNGTAEILNIVKGSTCLEAFVLVSTAYSNCSNDVIEERFYEPPIDPKLLIGLVQTVEPELLTDIGKSILGAWPNTYSFSKAVSEHLLQTEGKDMPVALFRPTIVTSTVSDPFPGWSDNLYGPLGILLSSNCGILRVIRADGGIKADTVPGDLVIGGLLCFAWEVATQWKTSRIDYRPKVINFSGRDGPLYMSIKEYTTLAARSGYEPFRRTIWAPMLFIVQNPCLYHCLKFLLHTTPAYVFDWLCLIMGQKPRMKKIYSKLDKITGVLYYFLVREWVIKNENVKALWKKVGPDDRVTFNFDVTAVEPRSYLRNLMVGLKRYVLKEDMAKVQHHKARYERLLMLHNVLKYLCVLLVGYPVFCKLAQVLFNLCCRLRKVRQIYRLY